MALNADKILAAARSHPKPDGAVFQYGTAGFRMAANILDCVLFRIGLLAALRSQRLDGKMIGVMITASHNPAQDNGAKLVDSRGEMLEASWEKHATELANAADDDIVNVLQNISETTRITLSKPSNVIFAHDTRPSCEGLVNALKDGLCALDATQVDAGLLTTPQLHYLVRAHNAKSTQDSCGEPTENGYYTKLADAYAKLSSAHTSPAMINVDCANGVGAPKLRKLIKFVEEKTLFPINIKFGNVEDAAALNNQCGADFVKSNQKAPPGLDMQPDVCHCSLDGDADRIVFYYKDADGNFKLLDGDKIATLAAMYIKELIKQADINLEIGVVQTAYANGSSTTYTRKVLDVPVTCTPTGVKHLHHAAEQYDIGVYFEANGHGTVLFSTEAMEILQNKEPSSPAQQMALHSLIALTELINQTVGDALSDLLLVSTILRSRRWGPKEWDLAYTDIPNRLVKVLVNDRNIFTTADAERRLVTPEGLQDKISAMVAKYQQGRSFVRPSGTEDCVRVYAEAVKRSEVDELAYKVSGLIFDFAGKGPRPAEFS